MFSYKMKSKTHPAYPTASINLFPAQSDSSIPFLRYILFPALRASKGIPSFASVINFHSLLSISSCFSHKHAQAVLPAQGLLELLVPH